MEEKFVTTLEWSRMEVKYILASIGTALVVLEMRAGELSDEDRELLKLYSEEMEKLSVH